MNDLTLYLLRHGESRANLENVFASHRIDAPLTSEGIRQAKAAARMLKRFPVEAMYSSPLLRARQTAEVVGEVLGLEPVFTPALVEVDGGRLEGKSQADPRHRREFDTVLSLWERGFPHNGFAGGETLAEVDTRLRPLLEEIKKSGRKHVALVGHCLLFMTLIWLFCENHGPTLEAGHMGRAHFSLLRRASESFLLEQFNTAPPEIEC